MYSVRMLDGLSTGQAAKKVGTTPRTLFRWIESGLLPPPKRLQMPGHTWFLWSDRDVKRAQRLKETVKRGRKPKKKK
jgi:DNA-binding transcriptional MerR regulator